MNEPAQVEKSKSPTRSTGRVLTYLIIFGFFALVGTIYYFSKSKVVGYEFNASTWQIRHFEFFADPFTNMQFIGVDNTKVPAFKVDPAITIHLAASTTTGNRWDLIELQDYHLTESVGPASIITGLLTTHRGGSTSAEYWTSWTRDNPNKAPKFWKSVQCLTVHDHYAAIPGLFELSNLSTTDFDPAVDSYMESALLERALRFANEGDSAAQVAAAQDGLTYAPNNAELSKLAK